MKKYLLLLVSFFFIFAAVPAQADDVLPPEWRGAPNSMWAEWDNWNVDGSADTWVTWDNNYYGLIPPYSSLIWEVMPEYEGRQDVVEVSGHDELTFYMDNYDSPNPVKLVRVQITYFWFGPEPLGFDVWTELDGEDTFYPAELFEVCGHPDGWITAAYDFSIMPNPFEEWIGLKFNGYPAFIDQVVIDTVCVGSAVPIPGAVWLLGSGLVGLVGLRRKFKS